MSAPAPPAPGSGAAEAPPEETPVRGAPSASEPVVDPARVARRRRQRRTAITLVLTVALLAGVGLSGWMLVTGRWGAPEQPSTATACAPAGTAAAAVTPAAVRVRVLNGAGRAGIAGVTAAQLRARGFVVEGTGNVAAAQEVVVRHGAGGEPAAALLAAHVEGATVAAEPREDAIVDLVLGVGFAALRSPEQAAAALSAAPPAQTAGADLPPC